MTERHSASVGFAGIECAQTVTGRRMPVLQKMELQLYRKTRIWFAFL